MVNNANLKSKPCVGVLMLNTRFPRFPGDVGNPQSFDLPVLYEKVDSAVVDEVITPDAISDVLLNEFISAGNKLIQQGADVITTSCGFLHARQDDMQAALGKPVVSSSLVVLAQLMADRPVQDTIGVMTFDSRMLGVEHLQLETLPNRLHIVGLEDTEYFYPTIKENREHADIEKMREDALLVTKRLRPLETAAVILECTNLSPFKNEIQATLGLPVFDLFDALDQELNLLRPSRAKT